MSKITAVTVHGGHNPQGKIAQAIVDAVLAYNKAQ